jgi:hypothetical protein
MSDSRLTPEQREADKAIEAAIKRWVEVYKPEGVSREYPMILSEYVMVCTHAGYDTEGNNITGYQVIYSENVRPHSAVGLLSYALDQTKEEMI